jgi:hypothetical protein
LDPSTIPPVLKDYYFDSVVGKEDCASNFALGKYG